jgi:hypothetical protein
MRSNRDKNNPNIVYEYVPHFQLMITDLFPGIQADRVGYEDLNSHIIAYLELCDNRHSNEENFFK